MKYLKLLFLLLISTWLIACAPSDGVSGTGIDGGPGDGVSGTGYVSLNITDAPIDDAVEVVITFSGVKFISDDPDLTKEVTFDTPKAIDLLTLQGSVSTSLLVDEPLGAGQYSEIRFLIVDGSDTYIAFDEGQTEPVKYPLDVPSGSSSGLKGKSDTAFSLLADQRFSFTVDFDVRKSIVVAGNSGKYLLKPVLRLVQTIEAGHIVGKVDPALLTAASCSDADASTYNSVYVFAGADVFPDDIDEVDPEPITSALVQYDGLSEYRYEVGFLAAGDYTLSFTCHADAEGANPSSNDDLQFTGTQNVTVIAGDTPVIADF